MSKIEELKVQIETEKSAKQSYNEAHARRMQKLKEELAALEAEQAKPLEFEINLDRDGQVQSIKGNGFFVVNGLADSFFRSIKVIEKKPVRVTKVMAERMSTATPFGRTDVAGFWVPALKAIGIDAIAAD